jgi:hypothetical protein
VVDEIKGLPAGMTEASALAVEKSSSQGNEKEKFTSSAPSLLSIAPSFVIVRTEGEHQKGSIGLIQSV